MIQMCISSLFNDGHAKTFTAYDVWYLSETIPWSCERNHETVYITNIKIEAFCNLVKKKKRI
jgi:hypothetical protein